MKKLILITIMLLLKISAFSEPGDTVLANTKTLLDSVKSISKIVYETRDSVKAISGRSLMTCPCIGKDNPVTGANWGLVLAPVLLFLLLFGFFGYLLRGFDFKDALSENELVKYTIINPEYVKNSAGLGGISSMITSVTTATNDKNTININNIVPPTIEVTAAVTTTTVTTNGGITTTQTNTAGVAGSYRPSISRYIAFFSGMLTVIIAVCMTSFFIYQYMRTSCPPDLSALSTVLIALGIGVMPYAVNKISTALGSTKTGD